MSRSSAATSSDVQAGPWGINDSKRLWGHLTRVFPAMAFPEGEGGPDASVAACIKVLSEDSFVVRQGHAGAPGGVIHCLLARGGYRSLARLAHGYICIAHSVQANLAFIVRCTRQVAKLQNPAAGPSHGIRTEGETTHAIRVSGARLAAGRLTAEIDDRMLAADVLLTESGATASGLGGEEILSMWMDGEAYELR